MTSQTNKAWFYTDLYLQVSFKPPFLVVIPTEVPAAKQNA